MAASAAASPTSCARAGYRTIEVQFGEAAADSKKYANKRVEMWCAVRDWLATGAIDDD